MKINDIYKQIEEAFGSLSPPALIEEDIELRAYAGKTWRELTPGFVRRHYEITLFSPAAKIYYLPAFLRAILDDFETADVAFDVLLADLTGIVHAARGGGSEAAKATFLLLTEKQKAAIIDTLKFIKTQQNAVLGNREISRIDRIVEGLK